VESEKGFSEEPGTRAAGPNGIELSADGEKIFLNTTLASEVLRIDRRTGAIEARAAVPQPDNLTWAPDGRLRVASLRGKMRELLSCNGIEQGSCAMPFAIVALDPNTMATETVYEGGPGTPSGAGTVGLEVDGGLLIGTFAGDRIVRGREALGGLPRRHLRPGRRGPRLAAARDRRLRARARDRGGLRESRRRRHRCGGRLGAPRARLIGLSAFVPAVRSRVRRGRIRDRRARADGAHGCGVQAAARDARGDPALRARGLRVAALTNNWPAEERDDGTRALRHHFDAFFESSALGMQKPDPRIYQHACAALAIAPEEAVFLDDIGRNLKAARALGMTTIKVDTPEQALAELARLLRDPLGDLLNQDIEIG
jgi:beta-phosphoglucomutase-like phosphatase (HAD superfamily)